MSYRKTKNLYQSRDILLFKECFASEKIHGTSAHLKWKNGKLTFFSGGSKHSQFIELFNEEELTQKFEELGHPEVTIYGEAYGGKLQGMSATYGKELKFIVFEVAIDDNWLDTLSANRVAIKLDLEFVYYTRIPTEIDAINAERDADSVQAIRNGMGEGHKREGVVLRPLIELQKYNGGRIIVKHKRDDFKETKTPREVNEEELKVLEDAKAIAEEWVTPMRLQHILDNFPPDVGMEQAGKIIPAMVKDVLEESKGEIVNSREARTAIGRKTMEFFKQHCQNKLKEINE